MAVDITISLTDDREAVLTKWTAEQLTVPPLSPAQFLRKVVRDIIDQQASRFNDLDQLKLRSAYKLATPAEQATIDSILAKYR